MFSKSFFDWFIFTIPTNVQWGLPEETTWVKLSICNVGWGVGNELEQLSVGRRCSSHQPLCSSDGAGGSVWGGGDITPRPENRYKEIKGWLSIGVCTTLELLLTHKGSLIKYSVFCIYGPVDSLQCVVVLLSSSDLLWKRAPTSLIDSERIVEQTSAASPWVWWTR